MVSLTRFAPPASLRRTTAALFVGVGLLAGGLQPARAADATAGDAPSQAPSAQQDEQLREAGLTGEDLQRDRALRKLAQNTGTDFYSTPAQLPAANGDVVRSEPSVFYLDPVKLIKPRASTTRILYKTTNSKNQAVAASGTVLQSAAAWRKPTPRPLVVLAPGTQGVDDSCAPSRQLALGTNYEGINLAGLINAGYNVVVPDYIGLGTEGIHTYMNRVDQAHAVLDAARAAQRTGVEGITAKTPVATVGYSQGGGATASAVESAPDYAPEIDLKAGWVGAPPADLGITAEHIDSKLFSGLSMYVAAAAEDSGASFRDHLNAAGQARYDKTLRSCTIPAVLDNALVPTRTLTKDGRSFTQLVGDPELKAYLLEQKNGVAGRHPRVPVRIAHSAGDDVVPYAAGRQLAQRWCAAGSNVSFQTMVTPTHIGGYVAGLPSALQFLDAQFSGHQQASSCWRL